MSSDLFKKTCYQCGAKVNSLHDGMCENCLKEIVPPIKEVKPIAFKIDNVSKEICYNNSYYTLEKLSPLLPGIVKKHLIINEQYELDELVIENVEVQGNTLSFDIEVECSIK